MVTSSHEFIHRIFQDHPEVLGPVLCALGVPVPPAPEIKVISPDATEHKPLERRADSVLHVTWAGSEDVTVIVESQQRVKPDKPASWAYYLGYYATKYERPALLLVTTRDRATARWAAGPFHFGAAGWTSHTVHPLVLGPDSIPAITSPDAAAENLAVAALAAVLRSEDPESPAILESLALALAAIPVENSGYWWESLDFSLGKGRAHDIWRDLMATIHFPGHGTFAEEQYLAGEAQGEAKGEAKGKAEGVLRILDHRGIDTTAEDRRRIAECTDLDTVDRWMDRAFSVASATELFAENE
ncbi:hypothetical protein V2W30_25240 [Streptomyces sp. Q6]|uniref:Uncharacterized protein n=1 Tax=Streptomyces citrinus TaxID=3118173 RepID=A0ACD5AGJ5_9ACTN